MAKEENTMLLKLYSIGVILFDILVLIVKCNYVLLESIYYALSPKTEKSLVGEIVMVTGSAHGIGRELAIKYASTGATVICVDVNDKGNEETAQLIKDLGYKKVHSYSCDITVKTNVDDLIAKVSKEVGAVTVLVNNAGIMPCHGFLDTTEGEIKKMFDVNVYAHFWLLQAVLPRMIRNNHGHIVALSSMAGLAGLPNLVPYCATKYAVRGYMEALAEELRMSGKCPNVHFTCVYPYMVDTGLCKKPRIKFPSLMSMVTAKDAAEQIVTAMRRNTYNTTLPSYYYKMNSIIRVYPEDVGRLIKDFFDAGVEAVD